MLDLDTSYQMGLQLKLWIKGSSLDYSVLSAALSLLWELEAADSSSFRACLRLGLYRQHDLSVIASSFEL